MCNGRGKCVIERIFSLNTIPHVPVLCLRGLFVCEYRHFAFRVIVSGCRRHGFTEGFTGSRTTNTKEQTKLLHMTCIMLFGGSILCTMESSYTHAFMVYLWHGGTFKYGAYIVRRYTQQINIRNLCYKLYYICTRAARIVDMQKTILYPVDLPLCKCSCFCVQ